MGCSKPPPPAPAQNKMDQYTVLASDNKETSEAPQSAILAQSTADLGIILKAGDGKEDLKIGQTYVLTSDPSPRAPVVWRSTAFIERLPVYKSMHLEAQEQYINLLSDAKQFLDPFPVEDFQQ
ncbi:hypothetical protein NDU88_006693 [Pleurodeles waltl]|uniref:Uncharacterized protein n=1 Tax=Pleurodeles waltl TaxID=8319 RepID=A0AAV7PN52_PLEWA|nr:hypothetical protein NDU88_006693 [Pleurodeles waltl]